MQPNKVLGAEVVAVRRARNERGGDARLVQSHSGTLSDKEIEMMRHSFTLMAGAFRVQGLGRGGGWVVQGQVFENLG